MLRLRPLHYFAELTLHPETAVAGVLYEGNGNVFKPGAVMFDAHRSPDQTSWQLFRKYAPYNSSAPLSFKLSCGDVVSVPGPLQLVQVEKKGPRQAHGRLIHVLTFLGLFWAKLLMTTAFGDGQW